MIKPQTTSVLLLSALLAAFVCGGAGRAAAFYTDTDRAKDLMHAQRYYEATRILQKVTKEDQHNAEAFFHLGLCELRERKYFTADRHFRKAFSLKPSYGYVIGGELKKAGAGLLAQGLYYEARRIFIDAAAYQPGLARVIATDYIDAATAQLRKARWQVASRLYREALIYRPDARKIIGSITFDIGSALANRGHYGRSDAVFAICADFDGMRRAHISDQYRFLGDTADAQHCIALYRRALQYGTRHNAAIGKRLLSLAASSATEREAGKFRREAGRYITVQNQQKLYLPGSYTFALGPNETLESWIVLPVFMKGALLFSSDNGFELLFDDGTRYGKEKLQAAPDGRRLFYLTPFETPSYKFRLHALTQQSRVYMIVQ